MHIPHPKPFYGALSGVILPIISGGQPDKGRQTGVSS